MVDRQHADVREDKVGADAGHRIELGVGVLDLAGKNHIDAVVGLDEAARRCLGLDLDRHGAHAGRQHHRHEAGRARMLQLGLGDRLARNDVEARHGADHLLERLSLFFLVDERVHLRVGGPTLPFQVVERHKLARRNRVVGH